MAAENDCIFCKIGAGKIGANVVHNSERLFAFRDINPQAPVHILVIPKKHIARLSAVTESDFPLVVEIHRVIQELAKKENLVGDGFRVVINDGKNGGQTVDHLHYHLLGGRRLGWPPG
jgi:histidine triad (HIT) family protein